MKKIAILAVTALFCMSATAQPKFAHVNFSELVQLAPEADQAREALAASSKEAEETYQEMVGEFNNKYTTYQQKAGTWTPAIRESKEKELTEMQQRIQEFQQNIQQELGQQQQTLMEPIYQKAKEVVETIAKQGGYIYVFDKGSFVYLDETQSVDITPAARKALGIAEDRTLEGLQNELAAQQQAQPAEL